MVQKDDHSSFSHVDSRGRAKMVDVGEKEATHRRAIATGRVRVSRELIDKIESNALVKGNLLEVARLAGIQAGKRTGELIPLCHTLALDHLDVEAWIDNGVIRLRAVASTFARTGVEMEALTAVSVAALTVIDMGKAVDPHMVIEDVRLIEKAGGRSGDFRADAERSARE